MTVGPSSSFNKTSLPSQYAAVPVSDQPMSDINTQYNYIVRTLKELWACIEGAATGNDINGTALTDYSAAANLGILPRLVAIEQNGKIQDSAYLQIGTNLGASSRGVRFTLGSVNLYGELLYDNDSGGLFKFRNQSGGLMRVQAATPTASADLTTKAYVDSLTGAGMLKKHCDVAAPTRTGNSTLSIAYAYAADSLGTTFIAKGSSTTVTLGSVGLNGILSSSASVGINGTISVSNGSATITGVGTSFTTDFVVGDYFQTAGGQNRKITVITNNTTMTAASNFSANESTVGFVRGGTNVASSFELNLYLFSDSSSTNVGFGYSTRNTLGGDTLVDKPRAQKTGSVAVSNGSVDIVGTGTSFTTEFTVGNMFYIITGSTIYSGTVSEIVSNTLMKAGGAWGVGFSGATIGVILDKYRQLPFAAPTDSGGNLLDFVVSGFPWNTCIDLRAYDASSRYTITSAQTGTSASSSNLNTNNFVPDLCGKIGAVIYATMANQANAPAFFQVAPASSLLGNAYNLMTMIQQYNSAANFAIVTNSAFVDIPLDANQTIWWKSSTTNASGGIGLNKVYMTGWNG